MIDLRDPLIALDFDMAVVRVVAHRAAQPQPAAKPVIVPDWDIHNVLM